MKQPRLLRKSGVAFVPNPLTYGPYRPLRLSDDVAYNSARISGPCLRFLDIEDPNVPQHAMFKEDTTTDLPKKLTRKKNKKQVVRDNRGVARAAQPRDGPQEKERARRTNLTPQEILQRTKLGRVRPKVSTRGRLRETQRHRQKG